VVRYLVQRSSGDRAVILAAIKAQCPHYLPAVADLMPGAARELPSNVIPMTGGGSDKRKVKSEKGRGQPEHPAQLLLFTA
jgi:hypothetical protein